MVYAKPLFGGTQSLHTNGFDEALGLPTEEAAAIALKTQQVVAFESGITDTADPLAGSYFVESLTNEVETEAWKIIEKIDFESDSESDSDMEGGYNMLRDKKTGRYVKRGGYLPNRLGKVDIYGSNFQPSMTTSRQPRALRNPLY